TGRPWDGLGRLMGRLEPHETPVFIGLGRWDGCFTLWVTPCLLAVLRQSHRKLRPLVDLAGDGDFAAVSFDDGFDQTETQAQPALGTALVPTIKARPDFVLLFGRNANAGVTEGDYG